MGDGEKETKIPPLVVLKNLREQGECHGKCDTVDKKRSDIYAGPFKHSQRWTDFFIIILTSLLYVTGLHISCFQKELNPWFLFISHVSISI